MTACGGSSDASESTSSSLSSSASSSASSDTTVSVPTLVGRSIIAADTYVAGPSSGQFISGGDLTTATGSYGYSLPFTARQPVQGISALATSQTSGILYAMQDNGFGGKAASPDALLHVYAFKPDWSSGTMASVNFTTGAAVSAFDSTSFIRLADPDHKLGFTLVADGANYPGSSYSPSGKTIAVDPLITASRYLTGGDIDIESMVIDTNGNFWFGDEFGPFLVKTDSNGKVLRKEIPLPNTLALGSNAYVQTSNNPYLTTANLPGSGGFEGMAINASRTKLYTMLERELSTDSNTQRRLINVFDLASEQFLSTTYQYKVGSGSYVNASGTAVNETYTVNDLTAINDHQFLVLEKDRGAGDARTGKFAATNAARVAARVKKVYLIDLDKVDADGFLVKQELVDLMNIADPNGIGGSATISGIFTFPMESVEAVRVIDAKTLMVANDNNYPGGASSRDPSKPDNNEFILIRLPAALDLK